MEWAYRKKNQKRIPSLPLREKQSSVVRNQLPNSVVARIMEDDAAEQEAERLSGNVSSSTPDELRDEMGSRLGADFSSVRFHDDSASAIKSRSMGARAWAKGGDVYFGRGGFDPSVAAHELVHTVQQGAVRGGVSRSMPFGAVQLLPEKDDDSDVNKQKKQNTSDPAVLQQMLLHTFSTKFGARVYKHIEGSLKQMIQKGAGKRIPGYTKALGIQFLVEGAQQNYSAKEILREMAGKPIDSHDDAVAMFQEYSNLIKFLSGKLNDFVLEELAMSTNLKNDSPKYNHPDAGKLRGAKRAYQMTNVQMKEDNFNPDKDPDLARIQAEIDNAGDNAAAYKAFITYAGNPGGKYIDEHNIQHTRLDLFKNKLKHMVRVVHDYPELQNNIGDMVIDPPTSERSMAAANTFGGLEKANIFYNVMYDRDTMEAEIRRGAAHHRRKALRQVTGDIDHAGTHELGHVLATLSAVGKTDLDRRKNAVRHDFEAGIIKNVLTGKGVLSDEEQAQLKYYNDDGDLIMPDGKKKKHYKGQLDTQNSNLLYDKNITSKYGTSSNSEFFAEAFHDVYTHGSEARKTSIEIVKEYERRHTKAEKKKIYKKDKRGVFRRLYDWFRF